MPPKPNQELPYTEDSTRWLRALQSHAMPVFLDSANHGGPSGSREVLAADPIAHVCIQNGQLSCSENAKTLLPLDHSFEEIIKIIRYLRNLFIPYSDVQCSRPSTLANSGAIIGYLGYPTLQGGSSMRIDDAFVGVYLWTITIDHAARSCALNFHASCTQSFIAKTRDDLMAAFEEPLPHRHDEFSLESPFEGQSSYAEYQNAFTKISNHIDRGDCYQVNLTQCFRAHTKGHPLEAYLKLRKATSSPFSAYMHWGDAALLSLSPERFVQLKDRQVLTQPVKGTRPRGANPIEDTALSKELGASEKDRAENLMIVDLLRNDIGQVCETGSVKVNQLFKIESYSNVHHMVSDVSGTLLQDRDAADLLMSCYPGGSITGAPKLSAMGIIQSLEKTPRRVYCGTVFCWGAEGDFDSNITIRSLLWEADTLNCWAGGGIVADSEVGQEYQECFDKINNIFNALQNTA